MIWGETPTPVFGNIRKTASFIFHGHQGLTAKTSVQTGVLPRTASRKVRKTATAQILAWPGDLGLGEIGIFSHPNKLWMDKNINFWGRSHELTQWILTLQCFLKKPSQLWQDVDLSKLLMWWFVGVVSTFCPGGCLLFLLLLLVKNWSIPTFSLDYSKAV